MKGIIYGIIEIYTGEILYVGSTSTSLYNRVHNHNYMAFVKLQTSPIYVYIREKCDREHFSNTFAIEAIKEVEIESKLELRKIERSTIEEINPKFNKNRAYRSEDERKEYHRECSKEWVKTNKSHYNEYHKNYYHRTKNKK